MNLAYYYYYYYYYYYRFTAPSTFWDYPGESQSRYQKGTTRKVTTIWIYCS